jgi:octaprenyl-diphosphate synthase
MQEPVLRLSRVSDTVPKPSPPIELSRLFEPVREDLERVEQEFSRHIESRVQLIPQIGRYIQKSGGKRIRPAVLLMASRLGGYQGDAAVLYASVVEFIHTATLVHDDIIDESELRRGRLAVHSRWGNDITVLLGDYLYIKSMALALTQDSLEVIRLLCEVTLRMIEGELYQLTKTGEVFLTEEEHFEIIRRKTAYLFAGCAQIGGMLGTTTRDEQRALWDYGFDLGIAFQLVDDLLDYEGNSHELGKNVGDDLREGKPTLPLLLAMAHAKPEERALLRQAIERGAQEQLPQILAIVRSTGALDATRAAAQREADKAQAELARLPPSRAREALLELCVRSIHRSS